MFDYIPMFVYQKDCVFTTEESARNLRQLVWYEIEHKLMLKSLNGTGIKMLTNRLLEEINKEENGNNGVLNQKDFEEVYNKRKPLNKLTRYGYDRRQDILETTPEEDMIRNCVRFIEKLGAHTLLTETVILLDQARNKLADWLESGPTNCEK